MKEQLEDARSMAEAEQHGPRPGNAGERCASDWRLLLAVPVGLVLQVCHPVIGAGVGEYSTYRSDPYRRFLRSVWPVLAMVMYEDRNYGADLRELHRRIGGTDHRGRRYHAWNPEAAFWVCATAAYASEITAARFGQPLDDDERKDVFHAWRRAALTFGIPQARLPATYAEYQLWFQDVLDNSLEDHPTAHEVIDTVRRPPAPPKVPQLLWWPIREAIGRVAFLVLMGTMPVEARQMLGYGWTKGQERKLRALGGSVRATNAIIPRRWRSLNGFLARRYESQIRSHIAQGAELGVAPSLAHLEKFASPKHSEPARGVDDSH